MVLCTLFPSRGNITQKARHHEDECIKKKKSMVIMAVMVLRIRQLLETYSKFKT